MLAYFDTAIWANLADGDLGGNSYAEEIVERFKARVSSIDFKPVFSMALAVETSRPESEEIRLGRCSFIWECWEKGGFKYAKAIDVVKREEVAREYLRYKGFQTPICPIAIYDLTYEQFFELYKDTDNLRGYDEWKSLGDYQMNVRQFLRNRGRGRFTEEDKQIWVRDHLPKRIELPSGELLPINKSDIEPFLRQLDFEAMPTLNMLMKVHEQANVIRTKLSRSDVGDFAHLSCLPYCDVVFIDNRMHELLRGANCLRDGIYRISEFEDWVMS